MRVTINDLIRWKTSNFSEDHLTNLLKQVFKKSKDWHIVYSNPPSGSWKEATLIRGNYLYRQVGPKRGVKRMKRPDIAIQYLGNKGGDVFLLLVEAKLFRNRWDVGLPELLRAYFEGPREPYDRSKVLRDVPFWHKQRVNSKNWEKLPEESDERMWFKESEVYYLYGFIYSLGFVNRKTDILSHRRWMGKELSTLAEEYPIVFMAAGWLSDSYEPVIIKEFSENFPHTLRLKLSDILPGLPENF